MRYKNLTEQIKAYLERHGPSHVSKVVMGLRHNANAREVNEVINRTPSLIRFEWEYYSYRQMYKRACVRLASQSESDYRDEYANDDSDSEVLEFL